jgi:hypothetical protein
MTISELPGWQESLGYWVLTWLQGGSSRQIPLGIEAECVQLVMS